ncbi:MAG TPA: hypothetical protein VF209_03765 [Patescibacteria group bacterium]
MKLEIWPFKKVSGEKRSTLDTSTYPQDVLYAIAYGGELDKSNLESLIVNNYSREFLYLAIKVLANFPDQQLDFFQKIVPAFLEMDSDSQQLKAVLLRHLEYLPESILVEGAKLAQFNRLGSRGWQEKFQLLIKTALTDHPDFFPVLIAHTPLFALPDFIRLYQSHGHQALFFFNWEWVSAAGTYAGYRFDLTQLLPEPQLITPEELKELQERPIYLFDDTIRDDDVIDKIMTFFQEQVEVKTTEVRAVTILKESLQK